MEHSPEINRILSKKTSSYYKIGVLSIGVLLIVLTPWILSLTKERNSDIASQISFHIELKDHVKFVSHEETFFSSEKISPTQFSHMYILSEKDSDGGNTKNNINIVLIKNGKAFVSSELSSKDITIQCEFSYQGNTESIFANCDSIMLKYNEHIIPLLVSSVKSVSDMKSIITAYFDFAYHSRFVYIPPYIPFAEILKRN